MARTNTTTETPRQPTFDINDPVLQKIIAEAVAARMAAEKAAEKSVDTNKIDSKIVQAFQAKGYNDVVLYDRTKTLVQQPDVTVLTFQKWMELGRRVKEGEHSLKIRGYQVRLFHKSQTRIATVEERKANFTKVKAAAERRDAKNAGAEQATA
ncbi:MAG TPA: ArdC-like ssDNA-binding domain-containing protein [Candidatus Acidoferrum sp.]|jgi:hypothetical protein|nr:ArdC-like ssDNA-binding domain-containing protein [Candidatus Acidoferrum sp.]